MRTLATSTDHAVQQTTNVFDRVSHSFLSINSILVLVVSVILAILLGNLAAVLLRRAVRAIGRRADESPNLQTVNRLRQYETLLVLSIAVIRTFLILFGFYFWWAFDHPANRPTAIIGASALAAVVISGAFSPVLRDLAAGSFMMAEQWYGVGDHIRLEPFMDVQGVVEQVTLRSTRIRELNGEVVWVNNQYIHAVHLAPKGIRTLGLEMFVEDAAAGERLIAKANRRLPLGPLLVITPLTVVANEKVGDKLWHITAIAETAPSREWLIEKSAVELIQWMDKESSKPIIAHGPLPRYADAERRFRRTIINARKRPKPKKRSIK